MTRTTDHQGKQIIPESLKLRLTISSTTLTARLLRLPAASQEIVWDKLDDLSRTAVEHMMLLTGWDNDRTRESIFEEMP